MTDETEVIEPAEGQEPADTEAQAPEPKEQSTPDFEDRAMAMGWTPKSQFKGDPDKWVDAETFVKRGEEFLPFLKANNKRLEQALDRANAKLASQEKAIAKAIEHISKAEKRGYEQAQREIQARLDQAAAAGDVQGVREAADDLAELTKEVQAAAQPEKTEPEKPDFLVRWEEENPWFATDAAMRGAAIAIADELTAQGVNGAAQLAAVTKRIKAEFPHKFENPNRRQPAAVEGGSAPPARRGKTYADLPPEAKAMCDDLCRDLKGFTREKYLKDYKWD